jgi:hypothetical protein
MASVVWDAWNAAAGYARLAEYVAVTDAVDDLDLLVGIGKGRGGKAEAPRARAAKLYRLLQKKQVSYAWEKRFVPATTQQVRPPQELVETQLGTCLDFATTYATMCTASHVNVMLAEVTGHAFVVLTPRRDARRIDEPFRLAGFEARVEKGVPDGTVLEGTVADLNKAVRAGHLIAVDVTEAQKGGTNFAAAAEFDPTKPGPNGEPGWPASAPVILVDAPRLQATKSVMPLPRPDARAIRRYLPNNGVGFRAYESDKAFIGRVGGLTKPVVVHGRPGQGKSMIARHLVEAQKSGSAWFLDASSPQALSKSLAAARFNEARGVVEGLDAIDREGRAYLALGRLDKAEGGWLVVLDNADGDPGKLRKLLPMADPKGGRQVVVTTTNDEWKEVPGFRWLPLPNVKPADLAEFGPESRKLIGGRRLMLEAFRSLIEATKVTPEEIAAHAPPASRAEDDKKRREEDELRGPIAFWEALQQSKGFEEPVLRVCAFAAYLPPDNQPIALLRRLAGAGVKAAFEPLEARGLLIRDPENDTVRIHRLFGAAIRRYLAGSRPDLRDEVVLALATDAKARRVFDLYADFDTVSELDKRLTEIDDPDAVDERLGFADLGVARMLEGMGRTKESGETFARAQRHLVDHSAEVAECLVGRARPINQYKKEKPKLLREALGWAREAQELYLGAGEKAQAFRALAMQGLLTRALSKYPEGGTRADALRRALAILEEADEGRQRDRKVSPDDKARSRFNLAGTWLQLAQEEPDEAAAQLDESAKIYRDVLVRRQTIYPQVEHPHIAACEAGLGMVAYYRALLLEGTPQQRSNWLREATDYTYTALKQRESVDGLVDDAEALKSNTFLAKVSLARIAAPKQPEVRPTKAFVDVMGELAQ